MPELQQRQRVRVREEGGASMSRPHKKYLGKEGTIHHGTGEPGRRERHFLYFVEFHGEEVEVY